MLYLFDIDGTLVDTGGAGMAALVEATRRVFQTDGPPLDLAGSTDLGLVRDIHRHFGAEATRESIDTYFAVYQEILDRNLAAGTFPGRVLDGVLTILDSLAADPRRSVGLLTGNIAGGAASKMRHFKLDHHFAFGAYGSDDADRNKLGPIALERARAHTGRSFRAEEVWVIGDTPKDIACARALGAKCLAVATGSFTAEQLDSFGADLVVSSLEDAVGMI